MKVIALLIAATVAVLALLWSLLMPQATALAASSALLVMVTLVRRG